MGMIGDTSVKCLVDGLGTSQHIDDEDREVNA